MISSGFMPDRKAKRRLVLLLGALVAFGPISLDMYLPALPSMAAEMNASDATLQLSLTACMIGLSVGQLFAGALSDRRGRRGPLTLGLLVYALSSVACAFAPSVSALVALRFVQGFSGAAGIVISRAIVRDLYSGAQMTKVFAMLMLVNGAAPILAPIAGAQLLQVAPWQGVFFVLALWGIGMLTAVRFVLPETLPEERRISGGLGRTVEAFFNLLRNREFMRHAVPQSLVYASLFAYVSGSPFVLQDIFDLSPQQFSLSFALNGAGIVIGSQLAGRLSAKYKEASVFHAGLLSATAGSIALASLSLAGAGLAGILPSLFFVLFSIGIVNTTGFSLALQKQGHAAGSASALVGLLSFTLGGIAAPLVGIGGGATAWQMGAMIAGANSIALICYFLLGKRGSNE